MPSTRYSVIVANRRTGVVRRFTLSPRPAMALALALVIVPGLVALGAVRKAQWQQASLAADLAATRLENESMRTATGALTSQIDDLQGAVDDMSRFVPSAAEQTAMTRLPRSVRGDALGGVSPEAARLAMQGPSAAPDPLGVLRQMLGSLQSRLDAARPGMERQAALARATPAIWPAFGGLSSGYGLRRDPFTAQSSMHPGLDLDANYGDPVYATADGVVAQASYHPEYGNLVTIEHGFGLETRYAHLSRFAVRPGRSLKRGDLLGYVGSTGRSTGAHLHYEVWIARRPVNPLHYLVSREPS